MEYKENFSENNPSKNPLFLRRIFAFSPNYRYTVSNLIFKLMRKYILFILILVFPYITNVFAENVDDKVNVRNIDIGSTNGTNQQLEDFASPLQSFFFVPDTKGGEGVLSIFTTIAFQIKNFFIAIAILFLIYGVIKLLFSNASDEDTLAWRRNIIWTSVGIFVMQIAFSVWNNLIIRDSAKLGSVFGWQFWTNVLSPIVNIMLMLASLGFLVMMIYAFYIIITGGGDEEKLKKGKNIVIYAIVGFVLIRLPQAVIDAIYGKPDCEEKLAGLITIGDCAIKKQDLEASIGIIGKMINFFNGFLAIVCVILIIYAGWLVFISWGDEEKLKKAKNIIIYIVIGFLLLIASHALFRFFILKG